MIVDWALIIERFCKIISAWELQLKLRKKETDNMTGVLNKIAFHKDISSMLCDEKTSIVYIGIDGLKHTNNKYGGYAGDKLIKHVAYIMNKKYKKRVYRIEGGTFSIIFEMERTEVLKRMSELRKVMEKEKIEFKGKSIGITVSIGVAFAKEEDGANEMIRRADKALYSAKKSGRNSIMIG